MKYNSNNSLNWLGTTNISIGCVIRYIFLKPSRLTVRTVFNFIFVPIAIYSNAYDEIRYYVSIIIINPFRLFVILVIIISKNLQWKIKKKNIQSHSNRITNWKITKYTHTRLIEIVMMIVWFFPNLNFDRLFKKRHNLTYMSILSTLSQVHIVIYIISRLTSLLWPVIIVVVHRLIINSFLIILKWIGIRKSWKSLNDIPMTFNFCLF